MSEYDAGWSGVDVDADGVAECCREDDVQL